MDSSHHELSENVWIEGSLRPEYGKSGFENENSFLAEEEEERKKEKKEENTRDRSVPDGSDNKTSIKTSLKLRIMVW